MAQSDIELALRIIDPDSPAVFRMQESMCEVATHSSWALRIIEQARLFGIRHAADGAGVAVQLHHAPNHSLTQLSSDEGTARP